jgi:hypothetical protein
MTLESAIKWSDAWCDAYRSRAKSYGRIMPPDVHRRMMKAGDRMAKADRREGALREEVR